jgi:hypothetical protein
MYFGLDVFCMIKARATEIDMLYTFIADSSTIFQGESFREEFVSLKKAENSKPIIKRRHYCILLI